MRNEAARFIFTTGASLLPVLIVPTRRDIGFRNVAVLPARAV